MIVKYGTNVRESLKKSKITVYNNPAPADIPTNEEGKAASITAVEKRCYLYQKYHGTGEAVKENMTILYEILWKQCDEILKNKIKADKKFEKGETKSDVIGLLEIIEMICMSRDSINYYPFDSALAKR